MMNTKRREVVVRLTFPQARAVEQAVDNLAIGLGPVEAEQQWLPEEAELYRLLSDARERLRVALVDAAEGRQR